MKDREKNDPFGALSQMLMKLAELSSLPVDAKRMTWFQLIMFVEKLKEEIGKVGFDNKGKLKPHKETASLRIEFLSSVIATALQKYVGGDLNITETPSQKVAFERILTIVELVEEIYFIE